MSRQKKQKQQQEAPLVVLTTGGSGGHVFPAEAIAEALLNRGFRLAFITDKRGASFRHLKGMETYCVSAEHVAGQSVFHKAIAAIKLLRGTAQAGLLLMKLKPAMVVGFGGYASIPGVMAAHLLKIPVMLHEQNAVLGRANRLLAKDVRAIATSFMPTQRVPADIPQIPVGLPTRPAILTAAATPYPAKNTPFHLLIFGGSQGAHFFSDKLAKSLLLLPPDLQKRLHLTQQVRPEDMDAVQALYEKAAFGKVELASFFSNMPELLARCHLLIGRAGASTLTEAMIVGRPALLFPLPTAADNHQMENARVFCDAGAGWLFVEKNFKPQAFADRLAALMAEPEVLKETAVQALRLAEPRAADKMAEAVADMIKGELK